jgi:hypothetical protein
VATVLLICFSAGLVHSDIDLDGIPDVIDPFPETAVQSPQILTPYESEVLYAPSREVTFTGTAEVGSEISLYEEGIAQKLSCQESNAEVVSGTGLLLSKTTGGGSVDQVALLTGGAVVAQDFYNTNSDSAPTSWRTDISASWATEQRDDAIDGICDYQAGGAPDDRCGAVSFPEQMILLAKADRVYLFDAQLRTFWKSIAVSGATSVIAENGKVFVGTATGVLVWDFANDLFTKTFTSELPGGAVVSLDTVSVGATQYLLVATTSGLAVIDIETDSVFTSLDTGILVGAAFTSSNRVLWATATEVQVSDNPVDVLANNWSSTDVSSTARFPFSSPGTVTSVASDLIGLTTGVARVFDDGEGRLLVQHVTQASATLPMGILTQGQWLSTSLTESVDVGPGGNNLDNVLAVSSSAVDTGADTDMFSFGGAERYLESQNNTDFSITGKNITVGAWVRRPDFGGDGPFKKMISHSSGGGNGEWDYWLSAGENFFGYGLNADPYFFGIRTTETERGASAFTFAIDQWQFLVGTYDADAGELRMYLDGQEQDQNILLPGINPVSLTGDIASVDTDLRLGWGYDQEFFNGDMAMPFVAAETYSPEQVALLYRYSNGWFAENTKTTLRGTSDAVVDVSCDEAHKECFVLTDDGVVTRIDGNLFSGGITSLVAGVADVASITPTYLGTWQCTHAFDTSGDYAVYAQTDWAGSPTSIVSDTRNFTVFAQTEQTLESPVVLAFPDEFVFEDFATLLWSTDEINEDYFVAQIATDVGFQIGVRQQVVRGHSARFDALEDAQQYYFRVKAQNNAGGVSEWSEVVSLSVDTSAPVSGDVLNVNGKISPMADISFSWEIAPFSDIGSGILWYETEISTDPSFLDETQRVYTNDRLEATSITFSGEQGETYFARVRAMDGVGNWSDWAESSGTFIDTTIPTEFSLSPLTTTAGEEILLQWETALDEESMVVSYDVWEKIGEGDFSLIASLSPETRTYRVASLLESTTYTFKVLAKNGAGLITETADQSVLIDSEYIGVPQWLSSPYSKSTTVSLEWTPDTDISEATQYQIFREGVLLGTVERGTTTFNDPDIHASGEVFSYQVRAFFPAADAESVDMVGEFSPVQRVLIDTVVPGYDHYEIVGPDAINTWRNKFFSFQLWGTDGAKVFDPQSSTGTGFSSGMDVTTFREGTTGDFVAHNTPIFLTESGSHDFQFRFQDRAGNQSSSVNIANVKLDIIAPTVSFSQTSVSDSVFETQNGVLSVDTLAYEIAATDEHSGVDTYEISYRLDKNGDGFFRIDEGDMLWSEWTPLAGSTGTISAPGDGLFQVRVAVTDIAGNRTISDIFTTKIDRKAPQTFANPPTQPISSDITVQIESVDMPLVASGISSVYYTKNGADPKASLFPIRHEGTVVFVDAETDTTNGNFTIRYYATDAVGNESETHIATNDIVDTDGDGLPDWWENLYGGAIAPDSDGDIDTLTALQEFVSHTNPVITDTDGDGVSDGAETSVGTDPLNGTDHVFRWISPEEGDTVLGTFTLLGTATPGSIAEVFDTTTSSLLGTATVDPQGRFALEIEALSNGAHALKVEFQHPKNPLAVIESETRNILVNDVSAIQPQILNIADDDQISPSTTRVLVSNLTQSSTAELFEILDNVVYSLATVDTTTEGTADIWLPKRSEARRIFILDHSTWRTSEIISFEQGLFIEGIIYAENGDPLENATVEVTDTQESATSVQSSSDGTYHVFVTPNTTYTYRVEATGFIPQQQSVTMGFDDIRINKTLFEFDKEVTLSGVVSDSEGVLLENVSVGLVSGSTTFSAITNATGNYSLLVPASKTYTVTFSLADHDTHIQSLEVLRDDIVANVTLVKQDVAVQVSGRIVSASSGDSLLGVAIVFLSNNNESFETQSNAAGTFQLALRRDRDYTVTFALTGYKPITQTFSLAADSIVLPDVTLSPFTEEEVSSGGQSAIRGWSGRELNNPEDTISDDWIPSMTYEESLAQVARLNAGIAGQIKTKDLNGEEIFAGYISGRIAADNFREAEDAQRLSITAFGDRVQEMHASAKIGHCLSFKDTTMDFRDVSTASRWYPSVAKIYSLGQMPLDSDFKFRPTEMISWETALEMAFAVRCAEPDTFELIQSFQKNQWETLPLQNTVAVRRAYTALDMGWVSYEDDLTKSPTREQLLRLWMNVFEVPVDTEATKTSFKDISETDSLAPVLVAARKLDIIPSSANFRASSLIPRSESAQWFVSFFEAEREDRIDRSEQEDQFDDHKVATGREVTADEQVRAALLQKDVAEERRLRIAEIVPVTDDLDIEGNSGFVRRQGEDRETFLKRLAEAKEEVGVDPAKQMLDYAALREQSLASRGIVEKEVESKIQTTDTSGFVRRQDETREEFLQRLDIAKQELATKKLALETESDTMKASAPKVAGPMLPTQNLGKLKIDIDTDRMCNIKMAWETSEAFAERCGDIRDTEKEAAYKNMFDSFKKRPGIQETLEAVEVTVKSASPTKDTPTLTRSKMDVALRRVEPELEKDEQTAKVKTRRSQLDL